MTAPFRTQVSLNVRYGCSHLSIYEYKFPGMLLFYVCPIISTSIHCLLLLLLVHCLFIAILWLVTQSKISWCGASYLLVHFKIIFPTCQYEIGRISSHPTVRSSVHTSVCPLVRLLTIQLFSISSHITWATNLELCTMILVIGADSRSVSDCARGAVGARPLNSSVRKIPRRRIFRLFPRGRAIWKFSNWFTGRNHSLQLYDRAETW